jgi:hypothetical protein
VADSGHDNEGVLAEGVDRVGVLGEVGLSETSYPTQTVEFASNRKSWYA